MMFVDTTAGCSMGHGKVRSHRRWVLDRPRRVPTVSKVIAIAESEHLLVYRLHTSLTAAVARNARMFTINLGKFM
jgi:hypothetical protein